MREGWEVKTLGEVCDILDNKRKPITKKDRVAGIYPYYGATGILDHVEGFLFDEKLVLIGEDGAKWGAGENTAFSVDGKYWVNNHAHVIRPNREQVFDQWIIYYLNGNDLSEFITGLTVPKLNQGKMRSIPIPLPPLAEQKRIVGVLDQAFAGIEQALAAARKNRANARALFETTLNTTFTQKGEGWVEEPLANFLNKITYGFTNPMPSTEVGPYLVTAKNVRDGAIDYKNARHTSQEAFDDLITPKSRPLAGDVLLTKDGTLGRVAVVEKEGLCVNQSVAILRPNERILPFFLKTLLSSPNYQEQMIADAGGATIKHIYITRVDKMTILVPDLGLQQEITARLEILYSQTQALEALYQRKIDALNELKQSLLQQAFAGTLTRELTTTQEDAA